MTADRISQRDVWHEGYASPTPIYVLGDDGILRREEDHKIVKTLRECGIHEDVDDIVPAIKQLAACAGMYDEEAARTAAETIKQFGIVVSEDHIERGDN